MRHLCSKLLLSLLVASSASATGIYWASESIDRANLDGTGVNENFITGTAGPTGIAVDGNYIYWANRNTDAIGRAYLDGTDVNQNFITDAGPDIRSIAVDATNIYWVDY